MEAEALLKTGDTSAALAALQNAIRKEPQKTSLRWFLFQLLCIRCEWKRAMNQLDVLSDLDVEAAMLITLLKNLIPCELLRESVFKGETTPLFFGEPQEWAALAIQTNHAVAQKNKEATVNLFRQIQEKAPISSGKINGEDFTWIADADSRLGPLLEAYVDGKYFWIPFTHITRIEIQAPSSLRDFIWLPATFTWLNGGHTGGFIPVRYPGITTNTEGLIQLARKTEWTEIQEPFYTGTGQKVISTNARDYSLMEIRELVFNPPNNL